eukprot:COSAG02_NODE_5138_length_4595_cov_7.217749_2_plen_36_part_00
MFVSVHLVRAAEGGTSKETRAAFAAGRQEKALLSI